jgi:hypothetical protein
MLPHRFHNRAASISLRFFYGRNDPQRDAAPIVQALKNSEGVNTAIYVFIIDLIFLSAVFLGLCLLCDAIGRFWGHLPSDVFRFSGLMGWLAIVGALTDIIENTAWVVMIKNQAYPFAAPLAAWATRMKWIIIF